MYKNDKRQHASDGKYLFPSPLIKLFIQYFMHSSKNIKLCYTKMKICWWININRFPRSSAVRTFFVIEVNVTEVKSFDYTGQCC